MAAGDDIDELTARLHIAEARLQAAEATVARQAEEISRANALIAAIPGVVMRVSVLGIIQSITPILPEYQGAEIVGQSVFNFVPRDMVDVVRHAIDECISTRQVTTYDTVAVAPDGTRDWYTSKLAPILDGDTLTDLMLVSLNTSRTFTAERALADSDRRLALALDAGGVGTWRWDALLDVVEWDDKMCTIFGLSRKDAPRTKSAFLALTPDDQRGRMEQHIDGAMTSGVYEDFELRADGPHGSRYFLIKGGVTFDNHGRPTGLIGGLLDNTRLRTLEEQIQHTQKLEAMGLLSAGIAHNFNNMLAAIIPALELMTETANDVDRGTANDALQSAHGAAQLVRDLMVFSRRGNTDVGARAPIASVVRRAIDLVQRTFDRSIAIRFVDHTTRDAVVDSGPMEQAIINLLINARDALMVMTKRERKIDVELSLSALSSTGDESRTVKLSVTDNAGGMDEHTKARIFEPFFTTKDVGKGTGLGLSTAWSTVLQHQGTLICDSTLDVGTTFSIILPLTDTPASNDAASSRTNPVGISREDISVLVVDDEPAVRRTIMAMLTRAGFSTEGVGSGTEAIDVLKSKVPSAVVLDHSMPGMSAADTLAALREIAPTLPIISCSGLGLMLEGATFHLPKPFSRARLLEAVDEVVAQGSVADS